MSEEKKGGRPPGSSSQVGGTKKIHQYFDFAERPASLSFGTNTGAAANIAVGRVSSPGDLMSSSHPHLSTPNFGMTMPSLRPGLTESGSERAMAHPGPNFVHGAVDRRSATPNRVQVVGQSQTSPSRVEIARASPIQVVVGNKPVNKDDFMLVAERRTPSPGEREFTGPKKARNTGKGSRSGTNTPAELAAELAKLPPKRSRPVEGKMAVPKMRRDGWSTGEGGGPKKKGRPPGSKNKVPGVSGVTASGFTSRETLTGVLAPDGTPMNRRGRPKGWRPGMSYAELRPVDPNAKPKASGGRRGRRPHMTVLQLHHHMSVPFTSYVCEWKGCTAQLHNLDTLRRHVKVIHLGHGKRGAKREGSRECLWGKCGHVEAQEKKALGDVFRHLEKKHLTPLAWHAGDGPKNSLESWEKLVAEYRKEQEAKKKVLSEREQRAAGRVDAEIYEGEHAERERRREKKLPRWLVDEYGNQVTESIEGQRLENAAEIKARKRRLKEWEDRCLYTSSEDEGQGEGPNDGAEVMGSGQE